MLAKLNYAQFETLLKALKYQKSEHYQYLYEIFSDVIDGINDFNKNNIFGEFSFFSHIDIAQYLLGEFTYSVARRTIQEVETFKKSEEIKNSLASVVADKYLSLNKFSYPEKKIGHKYLPPISSLYIYVNLLNNLIKNYQNATQQMNVIADLFAKSMSIAKCTLNLLIDGFETEALSTWRTLHECECTLIILSKFKDAAISKYLMHMRYGLAYKNAMEDKAKQDEIFYKMKDEMKKFNLKSKDIKKFIEYGWLLYLDGFNLENYKLNFRDGLEKFAGLSSYSSRYETSSEIIHSTPLLIYSNKKYFYNLTLLSLYESFFRLEKTFTELFFLYANEEIKEKYLQMRQIYYNQLVSIHKREVEYINNKLKEKDIA